MEVEYLWSPKPIRSDPKHGSEARKRVDVAFLSLRCFLIQVQLGVSAQGLVIVSYKQGLASR